MELQPVYFTVSGHGEIATTFIQRNGKNLIVFLHGIQGNRTLFSKLMSEEFLNQYDLLSIDFLGFGESSRPSDWDYDLQSHAMIIEQVLHQISVNQIYIIGHSLGGMVGTLLLDPSIIKVLGLISLEGNLLLEDCGMSKEVAQISFEEFTTRFFADLVNKLQNSNEASASFRLSALRQVALYAFYRTSKSIVKWSSSCKLKQAFEEIACRKLLLKGEFSSFHTSVASSWCKEVTIPNSGHFLLHDNYCVVKQAIQDFFKYDAI